MDERDADPPGDRKGGPMRPPTPRTARPAPTLSALLVLATLLLASTGSTTARPTTPPLGSASEPAPVANYTAAIQRIVTLLGVSGSGLLAIVWARVALSWFSNDVTKKIQAKDRARDALIGTILFTAAVSGLLFALAQWVVTGS